MFETIQRNLLEFLHFHDVFIQSASQNSSLQPVVSPFLAYFPTIRSKLEETLNQTKFLCETNIHCLAKITALQQEKTELIESYEEKVKVGEVL
jgi:hypothetical protein